MKKLGLKEGSPALYVGKKAYAEYLCLDNITIKHRSLLFPIPAMKPDYLAFGVSGLTATIGLNKVDLSEYLALSSGSSNHTCALNSRLPKSGMKIQFL